jgi:hypothetical protein
MSVSEALNAFSIEVVVAGKSSDFNDQLLKELDVQTNLLQSLSA